MSTYVTYIQVLWYISRSHGLKWELRIQVWNCALPREQLWRCLCKAMGSLFMSAAACKHPRVRSVCRGQLAIPFMERWEMLLLLQKTEGGCHKCHGKAHCLQKPLLEKPGRRDHVVLSVQNSFYLSMCKKKELVVIFNPDWLLAVQGGYTCSTNTQAI